MASLSLGGKILVSQEVRAQLERREGEGSVIIKTSLYVNKKLILM